MPYKLLVIIRLGYFLFLSFVYRIFRTFATYSGPWSAINSSLK